MGGRVPCTGPLLIGVLLMINIQAGGAPPCDKCYYPLYAGDSRTAVLRTHSNPSPNCANFLELQTCIEDGRTYWLFENVGTFKQKLLGECPMKEKWICSETDPAKQKEKAGKWEPDLIREKEVKGIIKKGPEIRMMGGKNLFLDLVEKISHEWNITDCWICGDSWMAEVWPWEGIALTPQETLKIMEKESSRPDEREEEETWSLRSGVIGEECLWRRGPKYTAYVGELPCKRYFVTNGTHRWWIPKAKDLYWARKQKQGCTYVEREKLHECITREPNLFQDEPKISEFWSKIGINNVRFHNYWRAPKGLFWLCGKMA